MKSFLKKFLLSLALTGLGFVAGFVGTFLLVFGSLGTCNGAQNYCDIWYTLVLLCNAAVPFGILSLLLSRWKIAYIGAAASAALLPVGATGYILLNILS